MQRGKIYNRELANQVRDFSGLRWDKITPTDLDGLVEYKNNCFVFFEAKRNGGKLPYGQDLALRRLVDNLNKPAVLFVANHETPPSEDIDMANTIVNRCYWDGAWRKVVKPITLRDITDKFLKKFGGAETNGL